MGSLPVRGLSAALNSNNRFKYKPPECVVDFLVIGGGVVGLAVAQRLSQRFPKKSTYLIERHSRAGEEMSSRNSEVIHSGLYYPPDSLKTRLCLRGRDLLYERCKKYGIPHRRTGKLVVAQEHQRSYIQALHKKASTLPWPKHSPSHTTDARVLSVELISGDHARKLEPDLSQKIAAALWVPHTGIVDSHLLLEGLEKDIIESENGELVYSTKVVRVDAHRPITQSRRFPHIDGWAVQIVTGDLEDGECDALLARTVINACGLNGPLILNAILPKDKRIPMYYARGSYASYRGPGISRISRLIYPCPNITGKDSHSFHALGTHLTLDLGGNVRFGPDVEWIAPPLGIESSDETRIDFWEKHLRPDESRLEEMHNAVTEYLPAVKFEGMQPDYVGIRPKLVSPQAGFQDFVLRTDYTNTVVGNEDKRSQMISLLGIESPGLTSSLAIAEAVVEDILDTH